MTGDKDCKLTFDSWKFDSFGIPDLTIKLNLLELISLIMPGLSFCHGLVHRTRMLLSLSTYGYGHRINLKKQLWALKRIF